MNFYNEKKTIEACCKKPTIIFELIKQGYIEVVDKILKTNEQLINVTDENGNDVMMKLLNSKRYDLVLKYINSKEWNINHQNDDGNTFSHILVMFDYLKIAKILDKIKRNKKFIPNIKNNKNETILDRAVLSNQLCTATKILKDKRFNNIDIISFKRLYDKYIKNSYFGQYSKLDNFNIIINNLEKKEKLQPKMEELLNLIKRNIDDIKNDLLSNKSYNIDLILESVVNFY